MNDADFRGFLEVCTTLSNSQRDILRSVLCEPPRQSCQLYERLEQNFAAHPRCQHCHSDDVRKHGRQSNRQRYQCKTCGRTFNALTGTPLAHLHVMAVLDTYLECMTTSMTLRPTARACGISLDTSFHLRHRIMELLQGEQAELLQGIVELDETFFRESHKGSRSLPFQRKPRKRGGIRKKRLKAGQVRKPERPVKKIPVLVACDRQSHMVSDVLDHMWWEDMEACLVGRIPPGTPVCADALAQHDRVAQRLGLVLKTLVTTEGQTVREGVFHLQHVNAHHSTLKSWVNNWFKGVASKYLYRYVGWRRALSTCDLTVYRLIEKLAGGWLYQLQS